MKLSYSTIFYVPLIISLGCSPSWEISQSPMTPNVIKVECRNEKPLQLTVKQILKQAYVSDWDIEEDHSILYIQARYSELTPGKAQDIKYRLLELPGVLEVEIKYDGVPTRSIR